MNGIISAGLGWILAGLVSGIVWIVLLSKGVDDYGMFAVAIVVLLTGVGIIVANKNIAAIRDSMMARKAKRK